LTIAMRELEDQCQKDGKKYIKSLRGGHQVSREGFSHDMQVVFLLEFAVSLPILWFYGSMV
jgi:hypothetical protein